MPACQWMMIRGCLRCIDGVSPNRVHVKCDTTNGPYATVQQLMDGVGGGWDFPDAGDGSGFAPPGDAISGIQNGSFGSGPLLLRDSSNGSLVEVAPGEFVTAWAQPAPILELPPFPFAPGGPFSPIPPENTSSDLPVLPPGTGTGIVVVPEPGTLLLYAGALALLAGVTLLRKHGAPWAAALRTLLRRPLPRAA